MSIRIHVTQRDIDEGVPGDINFCPVARAIKRKLKKDNVIVSTYGIRIDGLLKATPLDARTLIQAFDFGKPVQPLVFVLD